ncbi:MAG: cytochrome c, partial [Paracoccaceae bacterium]
AAGGLDPAPADLTRIAARNGGVFPWARVMGHIDGYKRRDRAGEMMPEFGARMQGPTVLFDSGDGIMTPTPKPLVDLARYLESIQQ